VTDDLVKRLRAEDPETGLRMSIATEAADRIEQLEAQVDRLRAAIYDMSACISRDNAYYMEPQTREILREIVNGGSG
jgi:hypothetical protein